MDVDRACSMSVRAVGASCWLRVCEPGPPRAWASWPSRLHRCGRAWRCERSQRPTCRQRHRRSEAPGGGRAGRERSLAAIWGVGAQQPQFPRRPVRPRRRLPPVAGGDHRLQQQRRPIEESESDGWAARIAARDASSVRIPAPPSAALMGDPTLVPGQGRCAGCCPRLGGIRPVQGPTARVLRRGDRPDRGRRRRRMSRAPLTARPPGVTASSPEPRWADR